MMDRRKIANRILDTPDEEKAIGVSKTRLAMVGVFVIFMFTVILFRLFELSFLTEEDFQLSNFYSGKNIDYQNERADILDRNGVIVATNLSTASLYANPKEVIDPDDSAELLCKTFGYKDCSETKKQLKSKGSFVWIKRHLSPREQQKVNDLGLPGLYFIDEEKRIYPHKHLFSHVVGFADIDNNGLAGVERFFDSDLRNKSEPLRLALDTRVQQILREEIADQVKHHKAIGGSGVVMDVNTGEVVAMVSIPDFDPNDLTASNEINRFNQITLGNYEMGSTFKILTAAIGFDGDYIKVNEAFNTDLPVKVGSYRIKDYFAKGGYLSVPEILMYSSNIGTAQIAQKYGPKVQREYYKKFGLLAPVDIELYEKSAPLFPSEKRWTDTNLVTISYGHGIAVSPMHVAQAFSSVVNGGFIMKPTIVKPSDPGNISKAEVISRKASDTMRKLMRLVVTKGSGRRANAEGYVVAGKTGTAEKLKEGGGYHKSSNLALFVCAFPIDAPKYLVFITIDDAKKNKENRGFTTGGVISAPVAGRVISRMAPILGIPPRQLDDADLKDSLSVVFQPRYKRKK